MEMSFGKWEIIMGLTGVGHGYKLSLRPVGF